MNKILAALVTSAFLMTGSAMAATTGAKTVATATAKPAAKSTAKPATKSTAKPAAKTRPSRLPRRPRSRSARCRTK